MVEYLCPAALPASLPAAGAHQLPTSPVYSLQLLLSLLYLLVVAPRLSLPPLLGSAGPLAGPGPGLVVPGRQGGHLLLLLTPVQHVDVGVDHVEGGGGPLLRPRHHGN